MSGDGGLAPIIPIFGGTAVPAAEHQEREHEDRERDDQGSSIRPLGHHAGAGWGSAPGRNASTDGTDGNDGEDDGAEESGAIRHRAEEALVRKLRARALSTSESRAVLRAHDLDRDTVDEVIDDFSARGYIDDRTLASLLVTSGVERKGQGRTALARSLAQRGIPRDIINDALDEVPDDDAERALEYARSKARAMSRLDPETALRRLLGQLARRGYGGSVATNAARTALREAAGGSTGVRFVESD